MARPQASKLNENDLKTNYSCRLKHVRRHENVTAVSGVDWRSPEERAFLWLQGLALGKEGAEPSGGKQLLREVYWPGECEAQL